MKVHKQSDWTADLIVKDPSQDLNNLGATKHTIHPIMQQPDHIATCGSAIRETET